jgi:hypothetical protein
MRHGCDWEGGDMRRKLFNLASVLSLLLFCVLIAVIGSVSIWGNRSPRFLHVVGPWDCSTSIGRMGMQIVVLHIWRTPVLGPVGPPKKLVSRQKLAFRNTFPHYSRGHGPFGFEYAPIIGNRANQVQAVGTRTWVMFPFRAFATVFLLLPAMRFVILPLLGRVLAVRHPGLCPTCSYDLTGNTSGICPECGTPLPGKVEANA